VRSDGIFIAVEVADDAAGDVELARKLSEACPVDIYAQEDDGRLRIVQENVDECVLCRLCLDAAAGWPADTVKIIKLYDSEALLV
jgi:ferredoxin-like protein FixX